MLKKLELIEYYDGLKNEIDLKTQSLVMSASESSEKSSIDTENLFKLSDDFNQKLDEILKKNTSSMNKDGANSADNLTCDCVLITKSRTNLKNEIGLLVVSDWFMNSNEKLFISRLFQNGQEPVPVADARDPDHVDDFIDLPDELELTQNFILIKHAYDTYLKDPKDILYLNAKELISQTNTQLKFDISGFNFSSIHPNSLVNFTSLTHLYLSGNRIRRLKSGMFEKGLKNLKNLDLFGCSITEIDINAFAGLSNLLSLNLGHNSQINLYDAAQFNGLSSLKILNLSDNDFQSDLNKLEIFRNLKNLVMLDLALSTLGNKITDTLFTGLEQLQKLDITHCLITTLEPHCFRHLKNLQVLDLQYNHISNINENTFKGLENLERLNIKECSIVKIEDGSFIQQPKLVELNLADNDVEMLNENSFNGLTCLRELSINYRLDIGVRAFSSLTSLKSLCLSIPPGLMPARSPQEIAKVFNIDHNLIVCKYQ